MILKEITILVLLIQFVEIFHTTHCRYDKYCNKGLDHIMCAYCNEEQSCELIDNNIFSSYNPCEYFKKHCVDGYCQATNSKIAPFEGYGECVCFCGNFAFGKQCEKTENFNITFPGAVQFITPTQTDFNMPATFIISVGQFPKKSIKDIDQLDFIVYDLYGGYISRVGSTRVKVESTEHAVKYCTELASAKTYLEREVCSFLGGNQPKYLYNFEFVIPFELYSATTTAKIPKSIIRQIHLSVYWQNIKLSEHEHNYHLDLPQYFWMYHLVRFRGCGQNMAKIKIYRFNDPIDLYAQLRPVELPANAGYDIVFENYALLKWEIYGLGMAGSNHTDFPIASRFNDFSYEIPPFKLYGIYYLNFTYKVLASIKFLATDESSDHRWVTNFNTCVFGVSYSGLVAKIKGGISRFVYRQHKVIMDLSDSRNPNDPDGMSTIILTIYCNWSTEAVCKPHTVDSKTYWLYHIEPEVLKSSSVPYRFTLQVSADRFHNYLKPAFATQLIFVGDLQKNQTFIEVSIICVYNCGEKSNPADIVYLRVGGSWVLLNELSFEWEAYELNEGVISQVIPVDSIKQDDTPSFILILNKGVLTENKTYNFKVTCKSSLAFAVYRLATSSFSNYSCNIDPSNGVAGVTVFKLTCTYSSSTNIFEFFDKHQSDESGFSGRMIASQIKGSIENVILTRGQLEIINIDEYGMETATTVTVQLSKGINYTIADINQNVKCLINQIVELNVGESLKRASVILDMMVLVQSTHKTNILDTLMQELSRLNIFKYEDAKLGISTLHIALISVNESLSLEATGHAARLLHTVVKALTDGLKSDKHCTFQVLYQIFSRILDCFYVLLDRKNNYTRKDMISQQYLDPVVYSRLKGISRFLMSSSFLLQTALSYRQLPAQRANLIESQMGNLSLWIKVDIPLNLSTYTQEQNRLKLFPVFFLDDLATYAQKQGCYIAIQYFNFKKNPTHGIGPNTKNMFDVYVCLKENYHKNCIYLKVLRQRVNVIFAVSELINKVVFNSFNISSNQFDYDSKDSLKSELMLPVYKLSPPPLSLVEAHFKFHGNETELLVMVARDVRPTFEVLVKEGHTVSSSSSVFQVVTNLSINQHLYYLAIYPRSQVKNNLTVDFSLKMYSKSCYTWHNEWETRGGCQPKTDPYTGSLVCQCTRLSIIGGLVKEVVFSRDNVARLPLYLTISPYEHILWLPLLLACFLLFALICRKADNHDKHKRLASILQDNWPGEKFGYLVCVITGARIGAGTDAAVGIKIYGTLNEGRSHILTSQTYNVMEEMGEDWFLAFEIAHLGRIETLDLWHDNGGARSDWFCDSIIVYDLKHKNCYYFVVNDWISLSHKRFPEVLLFPTPFNKVNSPSKIFFDSLRSGFNLSHLWLDTVMRHPRDPVSRVDRLAIILCFILTSMAASIILIRISDQSIKVDDYSYSLTLYMIELGFLSSIPAALIACLLMYMFRMIYKIIFFIKIETERKVTRVSLKEDYISVPSTIALTDSKCHFHYGRRHRTSLEQKKRPLTEIINLRLMPKPLVPVQIEGDQPNVLINYMWLFLTWMLVVLIVTSGIIITVLLSQNLPLVKTKKWFTITLLSVLIHALIFLPVKITFISGLLAVAFERIIFHVDIYTFNPEDGSRKEYFGNLAYLVKLVHLRTKPMYKPLHELFREHHRQQIMRERNWQRTYELCLQLCFLLVVSNLLASDIPKLNQANDHLVILIKDFDEVFNTTDYLNYIQFKYNQDIFKYIWYNWNVLSQGSELNYFRKDWMYDNVNRMVGKLTFRQIRVRPGYCKAPLNLSIHCAAPFSKSSEDSSNYLSFWNENSSQIEREIFGIHLFQNWSYVPGDSGLNIIGMTGRSYPGGGYTWNLRLTNEEYDVALERIREENWIDHYTRAVLMQTNVYNVNTRIFSGITLLSEQTVTGQFLPTVVIESVDIYTKLDGWLAMFVFLTLMFFFRVLLAPNFVAVADLFSSWVYPYEIFMTAIAISVSIYLLLHQLTVPNYVNEYQLHSEEFQSFDFYKISHCLFTARVLLCVMFTLNVIRFISLWRFGRAFMIYFLTFCLSMKNVIFMIALYIYFLCALFKTIGYILAAPKYAVFHTGIFYSHKSCYSRIVPRSDEGPLSTEVYFTKLAIMALCVCIFTNAFKRAKLASLQKTHIYNHFTFLKKEFVDTLKKPDIQRKYTHFGTLLQKQSSVLLLKLK